MNPSRGKGNTARIAACPQCGKSARLDANNAWRPFCSERCKLVDLGAWFSGERSIPADEEPPADPSRSG
ncbi:MAG: DNA gyrase inhibitor YacG [Sinimarinibacterium flocculans]|uniref:DNA gyrase inhibitor YacG n=1 Tax=Sinimarinibacterium flocculans TaxID=985250 RepID=UPI003C62F6F5